MPNGRFTVATFTHRDLETIRGWADAAARELVAHPYPTSPRRIAAVLGAVIRAAIVANKIERRPDYYIQASPGPGTVADRILRHLARIARANENAVVAPWEASAEGIASSIGVTNPHARCELIRLETAGRVITTLRHVRRPGRTRELLARRRKTYVLPNAGLLPTEVQRWRGPAMEAVRMSATGNVVSGRPCPTYRDALLLSGIDPRTDPRELMAVRYALRGQRRAARVLLRIVPRPATEAV